MSQDTTENIDKDNINEENVSETQEISIFNPILGFILKFKQ